MGQDRGPEEATVKQMFKRPSKGGKGQGVPSTTSLPFPFISSIVWP